MTRFAPRTITGQIAALVVLSVALALLISFASAFVLLNRDRERDRNERREPPLPPFVLAGGPASWEDLADGLDLSGHFLGRDVLVDRLAALSETRARLVDRLRRAGGLA